MYYTSGSSRKEPRGTAAAILAFMERRSTIARMIPRRLLPSLTAALAEVPVVALLGPRQAGKTTLALEGSRSSAGSRPGSSVASFWPAKPFARNGASWCTVAVILATLPLGACSEAPVTRNESQAVSPTVVQFLLNAAATDFRAHRPPDPVRFRDVRIGHVMTPGGEAQYRLCGQFLPAQEAGKAEWTPFATIKTSGYEQWIGAQAAEYCQAPSVIWDKEDDLSSSLQSQLDSLR